MTKIAVYGPSRRVGIVEDQSVVDVNGAYAKYLAEDKDVERARAYADAEVPAVLSDFITEGRGALEASKIALDYLDKVGDDRGIDGERLRFGLDEVRLHAPIAPGTRIFAGLANFADHMTAAAGNTSDKEQQARLEKLLAGGPKYFAKDSYAVSSSGDPVRFPARAKLLDYEAEIAVVIGKRGRDVSRNDALPYIWGYTLFNDWSVRSNVSLGPDFLYTKNFDTSATVGPWIVVDEITDPQDVQIGCRVNGEVRQDGNTRSMAHDFAAFIQHLSADTTLVPGDLIASGTPKGTAVDSSVQNPDGTFPDDLFLKPGDVVEVWSDQIGSISNEVISPTE